MRPSRRGRRAHEATGAVSFARRAHTRPPALCQPITTRLTAEQAKTIRRATAEIFGPDARVRLFGSRLDDAARGGDIDLLVESDRPVAELARKRVQFVARLQMRLGDQPIDVLASAPGAPHGPVLEAAPRRGVRL